jgi:hypothetical protein
MNLRCIYCQTPFTLGRAEMLTAIVTMKDKSMNHYDAHCPRCRRANSISRERMELFFPNWQDAAKQQAHAPVMTAAASPAPAALPMKTEPLPRGAKTAVKKAAPRKRAGKASSARKPAAKPARKTGAARPKTAVKTSAAKGKKAPVKGKKK